MQAAWRAAIAEVTRGVSTGLVVLAGSQGTRGTGCPAVSLTCPSCPGCSCEYGASRRVQGHDGPAEEHGYALLVGVFLCGVCCGGALVSAAFFVATRVSGSRPAIGSRGRGVQLASLSR